jgi:hypothetical protein
MSFHFFMRAWRAYMEYTDGVYDPCQFDSFLEKLDSWMPIEDALETMESDWSTEEIMDSLHATIDSRDAALDLYYDDIDETLRRAYTSWDGSRIGEEPDMDNYGYEDDEPSDMDAYPQNDEYEDYDD